MGKKPLFKRGTPVIFRTDGLREYAGLTGRVTHFHGDPGYDNKDHQHDEVWVDFDDPTALYRDPNSPEGPVGEGVWVDIDDIEVLHSHDGKLSAFRHVTYDEGFFSRMRDDYLDGIYIHGEFEGVHLTYEEALGALEWLKQQEDTLKQKAKKTE